MTDFTKRWDCAANGTVDAPAVDAFLDEVLAVCKRHGFSIAHEDGHGAFLVTPFNEGDAGWLYAAHVDLT